MGGQPVQNGVQHCEGFGVLDDRRRAAGTTLEECRDELESALEDWILFRVSRQLPLPVIDEIDLSVREVA